MRNELHAARATDAHALDMAPRLRAADREEVAASSGRSPLEALRYSLAASSHAVSALDPVGRVVCMFGVGVVDLMGGVGAPWLLGSDLMADHRREFARRSRAYLPLMLAHYPNLENAVDARHVEAIRWLEWLGFTIGDPKPIGRSGAMFRPFEMRSSDV